MKSSICTENIQLMPLASQAADTLKRSDDDRKPLPTLKECSPTWTWRVGVHLLLLVVPTSYLALLGIVGQLNGQKQSSFGDDILEVLQLAATLWPISFAAVLGPFLKTLALFKAERGATVGSLEFLLSGQTTVAAFKNLFTLQHFNFWTIGTVAVWCLSPLGGQAIVRSLSLKINMEISEIPAIHYFSQVPLKYFTLPTRNFMGDMNAFGTVNASMSTIPDFRRVVISALSGPDILVSHANQSNIGFEAALSGIGGYPQAARLGRQDMWHNVRVPFMEYLDGYDSRNSDVWTPVPQDKITPFSSFIGIPIREGSRPWAGNSSMILHSRYQTLQCTNRINGTNWMQAEKYPPVYFHKNILNATVGAPEHLDYKGGRNTGTKPSLWLDFLKNDETNAHFNSSKTLEPSSELQLLVGGQCLDELGSQYTGIRICNVSTSYVDIAVDCTRLDDISDLKCEATKIRRSAIREFSSIYSDLSDYQVASGISFEMPSITATYNPLLPSLLEKYIRNPPTAFELGNHRKDNMYAACYPYVSRRDFEARLATALNTFIMASYNYSVLTGTDGTSLKQRNDMWHDFTATWKEYREPVYTLNIAWFSISIGSTLILLACTASNAIIRHLIIAPDFLGSVDGLIRDSPFVKIDNESSDVSSGVSSQDRIKFTKNLHVQIQDVQPDDNMGKIALTSDVRGSKLDWMRVYTN
ncbi:uncharacterized protein FIESC28_08787 [Fusarium coffeatum]|uniref:Uncharacterized protein n=1 Tax=Fusarium coffeatum TaxID=231269 RepID=A0A366R4D3_9HYPO|nr:uncharacterized protein FIESC28_08787 [Fusarium coffeatum]RBR12017.1 hypothetical protein FIESC28_08787 [Fusarium coffeatum]